MILRLFKSFQSTVTPFVPTEWTRALRLLADAKTGAPVGIQSQTADGPDGVWTPIDLTAAQIATPSLEMIADLNATYRLSVAPFTRYQSDGTQIVPLGSGGAGNGTVTSVSVVAGAGIAASVVNPTSAPVITIVATGGGGGGGGFGIDVTAFGADPTGATSSDAAFESAKAVSANNTFYVPAGNFMLTPVNGTPQAPGQAINFDAGPCQIYMDPNARIFAAPGEYAYTAFFRLSSDDLSVVGGIVDFGAGTGPMTGCVGIGGTAGVSRVSVKGTKFKNCLNGLLQLFEIDDQTVEGCTYEGSLAFGYQGSGDRLTYRGNTAFGANAMRTGHQIQGGNTIHATDNKSHGVTELGLQAIGSNLIVSRNITDELMTDNVLAVWVGGHGSFPLGVNVSNNIADFVNTTGGKGVLVEETSQLVVGGNLVRGTLGRALYGVKLVAAAGDPVQNVRDQIVVLGNQVSILCDNDVVFEGPNFGQNISSDAGGYALLSGGYAASRSSTIVEATTTRLITNTDNGRTIITTSDDPIIINLAKGLLPNFSFSLVQKGLGQWTVKAGATFARVISNTGLTSTGTNSAAVVQNYAETDLYLLTGDTLVLPSVAKLSTANKNARVDLSGSNLVATAHATSTTFSTGMGDTLVEGGAQIYWEVTATAINASLSGVGICNVISITDGQLNNGNYLGTGHSAYGYFWDGGVRYLAGNIATLDPFVQGDVICVAVKDNDLIWFRVNGGNWNADPTADPTAGTGGISISGNGASYPAYTVIYDATAAAFTFNLGGSAFAFEMPPGFSHLP